MHLYLNGRIIPENQASIPVGDHGFLYGAGCFETFRTFGGTPFLLGEHLERLSAGCEQIGIQIPDTFLTIGNRMSPVLSELLAKNGLSDAVFRYTVSAGPAAGGLPREPYTNPTELLVPRPLPPDRPDPVALHVLATRRNSPEFEPRPKSLAYLNSLAGHLEMRERAIPPGDEGLMLTPGGHLSEGVTGNLFFIVDGHLHTPAASAHILSGITRQAVLALAEQSGTRIGEDTYTLDHLLGAEAIFITNSVRGLSPVATVLSENGELLRETGTGSHPLFRKLCRLYNESLP